MKIKIYNTTNSENVMPGRRSLRIKERSGLFSFSKVGSEVIGIAPKDRVVFLQDTDKPEDFYVAKDPSTEGFEVRAKVSNSGSSYSFNSSILATKILDKGVVTNRSVKLNRNERFIIGDQIEIEGFMAFPLCRPKPVLPHK
jgi:hypothetical protein